MVDIRELNERLLRLAALTGRAVMLDEVLFKLNSTINDLDTFQEDADVATAREILSGAVAAVVQGQADIAQSVSNALARLGDNATAEDVAAARDALSGVAGSQASVKAALDSIDPDVPGTGVEGTPEGEVVPAPSEGEATPPADGGSGGGS